MIIVKPISIEKTQEIRSELIPVRLLIAQNRHYFIIKRISDIVVSSVITLFLLIFLFPLIAILIKLESKGPVFFVQRRVGRGGRSFGCLKFRTMVVNQEANTQQAKKNDERITRIGRFLRDCNLDEFPQFINVLMGDMSIVGPRPHMHADCSRFSAAIPGYKVRNFVKPGITGLAQVKGYRGPTIDFTSMFHRYQFDTFYIRNAGFWLDMRIIRKTAAQTIQMITDKLASATLSSSLYYRRWVTFLVVFLF